MEALLHAADAVTYRHARVVLLSAQGQRVPQITATVGLSDRQVRTILHRFNQAGVAALPRRKAPGRQHRCTPAQREALLQLLRRPPTDFGLETRLWTAPDLAAVAQQQGIVGPLSERTIRREVRRAGHRWQRAKRWSAQEPQYERKNALAAPGCPRPGGGGVGTGV